MDDCIAKVAASSLECMPSFSRMFWMWVRTVCWLMNRSRPMRALSQPRLSSASTCRSRGESRASGESAERSLAAMRLASSSSIARGIAASPASTASATRSTVLAPWVLPTTPAAPARMAASIRSTSRSSPSTTSFTPGWASSSRATRLGEPSRPRAPSTSTRSGSSRPTAEKVSSAEEQRPTTTWVRSRENSASSASLNSGCESASSTRAIGTVNLQGRASGRLLCTIGKCLTYLSCGKSPYDSRRPFGRAGVRSRTVSGGSPQRSGQARPEREFPSCIHTVPSQFSTWAGCGHGSTLSHHRELQGGTASVAHGRPAWTPNETPNDLAMLAHELRRRVAALRVAGEAIATLRGQGLDTAGMMDLLMGEIDDLDELAREVLREGRGDRADAAADVGAAVRAAARTVAAARGVAIRVDVPVATVAVRASATMLRQAVENLLDNAASHGGAADIEVTVRPDPDRCEVDLLVADRGPEGSEEPQKSAPEDRKKSKEPQRNAPEDREGSGEPQRETGRGTVRPSKGLPTASGVRAGHGIGMFLVRRFLDAAGGHSWLAERQGGGTVVGLSLPLRQRQALEEAVNT